MACSVWPVRTDWASQRSCRLQTSLTGLVADPAGKFRSVEEYYSTGLTFAREYFKGRISERDRKGAEVSVELVAGDHTYEFTRGLFETEELRALTIRAADSTVVLDGAKLSESERNEKYQQHVTSDIGLASFNQFVFLQHFVLTFDERRHLLFWDSHVLEQALFLAFGFDYTVARRADSLRRDSERFDSLARNANWQAAEVRKKIKDLQSTAEDLETEAPDDILVEHGRLTEVDQAATKLLEQSEQSQRDLSLRLAALSARQSTLRAEYEAAFSQRIRTTTHVSHHPLVATSIDEGVCGLCGHGGDAVVEQIRSRSHAAKCPLCDSPVEKERTRSTDLTRLKALDAAISETKNNLNDVAAAFQRTESERAMFQEQSLSAADALRTFEKENYSFIVQSRSAASGPAGVQAVVEAYASQMNELLATKRKHYQKRDERRKELRKLQDELEKGYRSVEGEFVPLFKELAFQFLGVDLDVKMETEGPSGAKLILDVKNTPRREHHQLSESQRFFVDIALRMALAQFMSTPSGKATLFIDTPEGSLDIAYENRAGSMLATFIGHGFNAVMTANINSSRLLIALAQKLGSSKMQLCRMTSWAELSEVQVQEDGLFEEAYSVIEKELGGPTKRSSKK